MATDKGTPNLGKSFEILSYSIGTGSEPGDRTVSGTFEFGEGQILEFIDLDNLGFAVSLAKQLASALDENEPIDTFTYTISDGNGGIDDTGQPLFNVTIEVEGQKPATAEDVPITTAYEFAESLAAFDEF